MNESQSKRAVIVGVFVFVGLLFLIVGILAVGNLHETFKRKVRIVALFDDVSGLQTGNNIWFSGVKVGVISDLEFYSERKVKVILKVENKALPYIRKDAFVKLSTDGLIGNKILIIYGGTSRFPQVDEGDTLGVEKTFTSEDMINTLQNNNKNFLAITDDFKIISNKLTHGDGTIGKLLNDNAVYDQLNAATLSLQNAAGQTQNLIHSLSSFSDGFNKKGTLANQLVTDTVVFSSLKASVFQVQQMADTATALMNHLNEASSNSKTSIGVLLHDEEAGASLKQTIKNLETSSKKLDEDLEAAQHNFLLRGFFKKKEKDKR